MKKLDKNIIRLELEMDLIDSYDYDIIYLDRFSYEDIINHIINLNSDINDNIITEKDIFHNLVRGRENYYLEILKDYGYGDYIYDLEELEKFTSLQDYIDAFSEIDLLDFFSDVDDNEFIEKLCTKNNCQFGTVGYSPWSYYIAYKSVEYSFIRDLYEGCNWYVISLWSEDGDMLDSLGSVYAPNIEELDSVVSDYFGLEPDNYYLIDNMYTQYFDKPKVKEFITKNYHFEIID